MATRREFLGGIASTALITACAAQAAPVRRRWKIGLNLLMAKSLGLAVPDVVLHQATDVVK